MPPGRAFAQATFQGRFIDQSRQWRRHHRNFVIGWAGPLFWPYAYSDFVDYTFYSYGSDTFWPYAYDDLYESVFGRYAYGSAYAAVPPAGDRRGGRRAGASTERRALNATDVCSAQTAGLTDWPIEQIAQTVQANDAQRAALDGLKTATAKALDILNPPARRSCRARPRAGSRRCASVSTPCCRRCAPSDPRSTPSTSRSTTSRRRASMRLVPRTIRISSNPVAT